MKEYLKMADVFTDSMKKGNNLVCGKTLVAKFVDVVECDYAAHAINSHDELVENMNHYKAESERWESIATKEASRCAELVEMNKELIEALDGILRASVLSQSVSEYNAQFDKANAALVKATGGAA